MLLLLALVQVVSPDEVPVPARLFHRSCAPHEIDTIVVCGGKRTDPNRLAREPARPDPMVVDRRPRIKLSDNAELRIGLGPTLKVTW